MRFWFFVQYTFRRPRQSQRLFYKHFCHWLINSLSESPIVCENIFMCQHALMVEEGAFSHKIDFVNFCVEDLKSWSAYKSHYWFKSYGNFAKWVERCCEQFDEQVLLVKRHGILPKNCQAIGLTKLHLFLKTKLYAL